MLSCLPEARAFTRDSKNAAATQARLLHRIVARNRNTWFGRRHAFDVISSPRQFQAIVPMTTYDDYRDAVDRIGRGESGVLTTEQVRLLEPTGGSSLGEKLIPYTPALQRSFQRALRTWIWNLYTRRPAVRRGRAYWSITPLAHVGRRTAAGIPIGFDDDTAYLGPVEKRLAAKTIVAPPGIAQCASVYDAQYATLFHLLRADDLSLISVWSPTFLIELLKLLWSRRDELSYDVARGRLSIGRDAPLSLQGAIQPLTQRAGALQSIFNAASDVSECLPAIWPSLALVSCWADGPSAVHANNLRSYLHGIELQPKGLLATEAFVSFPLVDAEAPVLAIRSHFFEFQPVDSTNSVEHLLLAHELSAGRRYRVIVTTDGGLYRYQLHDEVEVAGFHAQVPLLRFVGKTNETSDLVGEKLDAAHVQSAFDAAFDKLQLRPTYAQLRAVFSPPHYAVEIACAALDDDAQRQRQLCELIERGLNCNSAYRYARSLGQLQPLELKVASTHEAETRAAAQTAARVAAGQRLGDIKPATMAT
jgi:hypothetical protein